MKPRISNFRLIPLALGPLLFTSCVTKPGIEILSKPIAAVAEIESLSDSGEFSPSIRAVLKQEGLTKLAETDPPAAIRALEC